MKFLFPALLFILAGALMEQVELTAIGAVLLALATASFLTANAVKAQLDAASLGPCKLHDWEKVKDEKSGVIKLKCRKCPKTTE